MEYKPGFLDNTSRPECSGQSVLFTMLLRSRLTALFGFLFSSLYDKRSDLGRAGIVSIWFKVTWGTRKFEAFYTGWLIQRGGLCGLFGHSGRVEGTDLVSVYHKMFSVVLKRLTIS